MNAHPTLAAVDLGSNSFRLEVARVEGDQLYPLDSLKETVRLAAGLDADKRLDEAAQRNALQCLSRFGERLRGLPKEAVRCVGTSALRVAKNAPEFLARAEAALGFPIEVVAGREEARLIYLGVAHSLPPSGAPRLVVDIGGGSTECIIGQGLEPEQRESLHMGCVNFSLGFFPGGRIDKAALKRAELAARAEVLQIERAFSAGHWEQAIGSSGTARALAEVQAQNGWSDGAITRDGLDALRAALLRAGHIDNIDLPGLKSDRRPVIAGGFAIMSGIFTELGIERMEVADGAMREGILYDLLGRFHHQDMREATVRQFMRRYRVDTRQARRVEKLALELFLQASDGEPRADDPRDDDPRDDDPLFLAWAARLHEVGISIAHGQYHRHSAYILENADMPGFSRMDQAWLARLVRTHRGSLAKVDALDMNGPDALPVLCLRLAALLHRSRMDLDLPEMRLTWQPGAAALDLPAAWLKDNPLTRTALEAEARAWRDAGVEFITP
jgi:exopolyphosphatase/guanosine-5'-triphosphate,3'-diphosphate pyrophosphatase